MAVNCPAEDDRQWHLRIFKEKRPDGHFVAEDDKREAWAWQVCRPAEEVWSDIFLGWERCAGEQAADAVAMESELVKRLRRQIAWLCEELAHADMCPSVSAIASCDNDCPRCWEQASLKAVKEKPCP